MTRPDHAGQLGTADPHSVGAAARLRAEAAHQRAAAADSRRRAREAVSAVVRSRTERYAVPTEYGELLVRHCAWCARVQAASGAWHALPPQARLDTRVLHSHGICPACHQRHWPAHIG